jgi:AcrR family transcriptional regulator
MPSGSGASVAQLGARPRAALGERTRERILEGALRAIARHGLAKLGMNDVSASAGVSRGTLYRYFPSREELLENLAAFETRRFQQRVGDAVASAVGSESRMEVAIGHVARYVAEQPAIRRILETEPAFVLGYLREHFSDLRARSQQLLAPLLRRTEPVRSGAVTADQLVDWLTRVMISAVLFPDPDPDEMARGLTAVYRLLGDSTKREKATPRRSRAARRRPRKERR